jgi:hypothetical protein
MKYLLKSVYQLGKRLVASISDLVPSETAEILFRWLYALEPAVLALDEGACQMVRPPSGPQELDLLTIVDHLVGS